jgi:ATP adenylyltransferase
MDCHFCEESLINLQDKKEIVNRIIYSSENFNVFPTLGSFVEGYLLIAPKSHHISIAQIISNLYVEFEEVIGTVRDVLSIAYCQPIFFEHGPISRYDKGGCCIQHAHLHCVPVDIEILEDLSKHFKYEEINKFSELPKEQSYLFYENKDKKRFVFPLDSIIPSQYIRQILSVRLKCPEKWDWRQYPGLEEIKKTIKTLKELF